MSGLHAGQAGREGLLDTLASIIGCTYLSDLRFWPWKLGIETVLRAIPAGAYTVEEWADAVHYLTGHQRAFASAELAKQYLIFYLADPVRLREQAAEGKDCMQ